MAFFARVEGLDRSSRVPLYYQLQEVLKQDIDAGYWQPGQLLPSEASCPRAWASAAPSSAEHSTS